MKNTRYLALWIILLFAVGNVAADTIKLDPRTRDEDISNTDISINYRELPNGMYEYIYDVSSSPSNKGVINNFVLNIACSDDFGEVDFGEPQPYPEFIKIHPEARFVPVLIEGVDKLTYWIGIGKDSKLTWGMRLRPGSVGKRFRIVSPGKPRLIEYNLVPIMDAFDWDYITYPVTDPDVPGLPDFTVTGMILGPGCPSANGNPNTPPVEPPPARFLGSNKRDMEPESVNSLLTYEKPLVDRFHVDSSVRTLELTIHYHKTIDPASFNVQPANLKHYFNPVPGTTETISLPLKNNKNRSKIKLEVRGLLTDAQKARGSKGVTSGKLLPFTMKDTDEFEIRFNE